MCLGLPASIHFSVGWLGELLICIHFILQANQDCFQCVGTIPWVEHLEVVGHHSVALIDTWDVYFGVKLDLWCLGWIVFAADDCKHVYPIIEVGARWAYDGSVPVGEGLVVSSVEAV